VEHRDGSCARTFVNHSKRTKGKKDKQGGSKAGQEACDIGSDDEKETCKWKNLDHTDEEIAKGYHHIVCHLRKDVV
jgi:platelet-activating factor acetylhydrolase